MEEIALLILAARLVCVCVRMNEGRALVCLTTFR